MSIIDQLGGYEAAKKAESEMIRELNTVGREGSFYKLSTLATLAAEGHLSALQKDLLEYRRAHNMFEVGDSIMHGGRRCEIRCIYPPDRALVASGPEGWTIFDFPRGIRHATDEVPK